MKMTTAERIEKMMRLLGNLDQPSFGSLAGASKSVVNQWLSGEIKSVGAKYAFRLQRKTGFNAEWIQLGEGPERVSESVSSDQKIIDNRLLHLSPATRKLVEEIITAEESNSSTPQLIEALSKVLHVVIPTRATDAEHQHLTRIVDDTTDT